MVDAVRRRVAPRVLAWAARVGYRAVPVAASLFIVVYIGIALGRIRYPYELEWMEGGEVANVARVLHGQPLFVPPSIDFVPYAYAPLYLYVSAAVARITGLGFFPLRLVSFLASLGAFVLIFVIVRRRTLSTWAAFLAVCLYAAVFKQAGGWFDLARVDSLFVFLLLAGIDTADSPRWWVACLASPVLVFLSFLTKQTALFAAVGLAAAAALDDRRDRRAWFALIFSGLVVTTTVAANVRTGGWYRYYLFDVSAQHAWMPDMVSFFWTHDLIAPMSLAMLAAGFALLEPSRRMGSRHRQLQDGLIFGSLLAGSYVTRVLSGGFLNVLLPVYAGLAIYGGIGLSRAFARAATPAAQCAVLVAAALQFGALAYNPMPHVPSEASRQAGQALQDLIARQRGEVYLSDHPWYTGSLGRPTAAQDAAVRDILRASSASDDKKALLRESLATAVTHGRYVAFIVDFEDFPLKPPDFDAHYRLVTSDLTPEAIRPVEGGWRRKPMFLYLRRQP